MSLALPVVFGRYRLDQKLGEGGMGAVYLAWDTQLERFVALKKPHVAEDQRDRLLQRFRREVRTTAALAHPGICRLLDAGEVNGEPFLTMDYIDGRPLNKSIQRGLDIALAVDLVRRIAAAVDHAHRQNIIHRDLKPANIMLRKDGSPVVMDFGLAKNMDKEESLKTETGQALGTWSYMPLEQARGDKTKMGPTCDVYSLGVILYELLTGERPREGPPMAVLFQLLNEAPKPPSEHRPGLDKRLERICLKAMAKEPEDRYPSMAAFGEALATFAGTPMTRPDEPPVSQSQPTQPPPRPRTPKGSPTPTKYPVAKPARKKFPIGTILLIALPLATLVLAITLAAWPSPTEPKEKPIAQGNPKDDKEDPNKANPPPPVIPTAAFQVGDIITNSIGMKLAHIPAGKFLMGSPEGEANRGKDEDQHEVELTRPFFLGIYEVTQGEWERVMGKDKNRSEFKIVAGEGTSRFPVENVTHDDAVEFCWRLSELPEEIEKKRSYRLPTEAEWEYSCRGGASDARPFYFERPSTSASSLQANFNGNFPYGGANEARYLERTTTVGSYKPNAFGLYDMHGNVWEWCDDWYGPYDKGTIKDPKNIKSEDRRVLRGGSWFNRGHLCRAAHRDRVVPGNRSRNFGFRVAVSGAKSP